MGGGRVCPLYLSIYLSVYLSIYIYIYTSIHKYTSISLPPSPPLSLSLSLFLFLYTSVYIYIYIYINILHAGAVLGQDVWVSGGSVPSRALSVSAILPVTGQRGDDSHKPRARQIRRGRSAELYRDMASWAALV